MKKRCARCSLLKPLSEFHRYRKGSEARQSRCKVCDNAWAEERRLSDLKTSRRKKRLRYRPHASKPLSPDEIERRRLQSRRGYYSRKPQHTAHALVKSAVRRGEKWAWNILQKRTYNGPMMFRPPHCPWCGQARPNEAHHYRGYDPENRLWGTIWVCQTCHRDIGVLMREALLDHLPAIEGFKRFLREHGIRPPKIIRFAGTGLTNSEYNEA